MKKETKQTLAIAAVMGSMYLSPLVILENMNDARVFNVEGKDVWVSQHRNHAGPIEMYTGMGFAGHRSFDRDNDGVLDSSQWEIGTPKRTPMRGNEKVTEARQEIYEKVRGEYLTGKGEIRGFEGIYNSIVQIFR